MGLLEMKSNLSQIERNPIQKNIADQAAGLSKPIKSSPRVPDPINTAQGVNFIPNINANGFTTNRYSIGRQTDFILNENGGPIIPPPLFLDIKGDFTTTFSPTNPAYPNTYNRGNSPTPLQRTPLTFDVSSIVQGRLNPTSVSYQSLNSRLNDLHIRGRDDDNGFTRPALSLDRYYSQAKVDTSRFGIRKSRLFEPKQPFIIRDVNQRWGINQIQLPNFIPPLIQAAANRISDLSAPVFGRDIGVFADRYRADIIRLSGFANPISNYSIKQIALQRRNSFDQVTSVKYGLSDIDRSNPIIDVIDAKFPGAADRIGGLNPQIYNPGSVLSVPGVSGLMFNRAGREAFAVDDFAKTAVGIVGHVSLRALQLSAPAVNNFVNTKLGPFVTRAGEGLKNFGKSIGTKLSGFSIPGVSVPSINLPKGGGVKLPSIGISNPFKGGTNSASRLKINKLADSKAAQVAKSIGSGVVQFGKGTKKFLEESNESRKKAGLLFNFEKGKPDKLKLSSLDPAAFQNINVDKINLIPYGEDKYEGAGQEINYENLDFIPFKFEDVRNNKHLVFRAILSGITDTFSPSYTEIKYVGRPDNVYVYSGTTRNISFTLDVYPKSDTELITLWEKMNYLAGLTYPHLDSTGQGMIAPFTKLTLGDMYRDAPGYISSLSFTVQDNTTWEIDFAKLPKYIQVNCEFIYIGDRLPTADQKHFDCPWISEVTYGPGGGSEGSSGIDVNLLNAEGRGLDGRFDSEKFKDLLSNASLGS